MIVKECHEKLKEKEELQTTIKVFIYAWGQFYTGNGVGLKPCIMAQSVCLQKLKL